MVCMMSNRREPLPWYRKANLHPMMKRALQKRAARDRPKLRKEAKVHMTDKETHRIAVVNMDWDHIKAVDLYMIMTSRIPEGGRVLSVSVYPSEFGINCMYVEESLGPSALIGVDPEEDSTDLDSEIENNKLHTYGLNRKRFYYAVVVCDSSATALHLYTTFDGTEFLKTENVFDLRFIPGFVSFHYRARDVATELYNAGAHGDGTLPPTKFQLIRGHARLQAATMDKGRQKQIEGDESSECTVKRHLRVTRSLILRLNIAKLSPSGIMMLSLINLLNV